MGSPTEYQPRRPNLIVSSIRLVWYLVLALLIALGIGVLIQMLDQAWWWEVPIVLVFGVCVVVLIRNRRRRLG